MLTLLQVRVRPRSRGTSIRVSNPEIYVVVVWLGLVGQQAVHWAQDTLPWPRSAGNLTLALLQVRVRCKSCWSPIRVPNPEICVPNAYLSFPTILFDCLLSWLCLTQLQLYSDPNLRILCVILSRDHIYFSKFPASWSQKRIGFGLAFVVTNQLVDFVRSGDGLNGLRIGNLDSLYSSRRQVCPALGNRGPIALIKDCFCPEMRRY